MNLSTENSEPESDEYVVDAEQTGARVDVYLMSQLKNISRVKIGRLINQGNIKIDGKQIKPSHRLKENEVIQVLIPPPEPMGSKPENIELDVLHEDDDLIVVNKPAGMVVHPAKGNWSGTLTAALTYRFSQLSSIGGDMRPGIVHRLDRDTTGVILVAKNDVAHMNLTRQFEQRTVEKTYVAIVSPSPDRDRDWIREPIGVHPYQREKMAIRAGHRTSRDAETFFEVQERFKGYALIHCFPKTGRTHQIRVHLAHLNCPILCDRLYSSRARIEENTIAGMPLSESDNAVLLERQALHAHSIVLKHPASGEPVQFDAPLADDMENVLSSLRKHRNDLD